FDLAQIAVTLTIDGALVEQRNGGHPTVDPLLPAVALANHLRTRGGVAAGRVMTTGTYTKLAFAKPGQTVVATFADFGSAEVRFEP
ncbi:MAG: fumarylacetoacetate hydrolase family protein, partial [Casimicrobiaceae bacterium]